MGKQLRQQRRGKGGAVYRSPGHRHISSIRYPNVDAGTGRIVDLIHAPGRSGPLAKVDFAGENVLMLAAEGMMVGKAVSYDLGVTDLSPGNVVPLSSVPEGSFVYNIEGQPGDGGKFVRAAAPRWAWSPGVVRGRSHSARRATSSTPTGARARHTSRSRVWL
jgi:large subunit ribosomal protein L2